MVVPLSLRAAEKRRNSTSQIRHLPWHASTYLNLRLASLAVHNLGLVEG